MRDSSTQLTAPTLPGVRVTAPAGNTAVVEHQLSARTIEAAGELSADRHDGIADVMLAALAVLVARSCDQTTFVLGHRTTRSADPVRTIVEVAPRQTFRDLVRDIGGSRFADSGDDQLSVVLTVTRGWAAVDRTDATDLEISVDVSGSGPGRLALTYRTGRIGESTAWRLARRYRQLLSDAVAHPDRQVRDLSMLPSQERMTVLYEWNRSDPVGEGGTLAARFDAQARRTPERLAATDEYGVSLTYDQLRRRVNRLAHRLLDAGLRREERCAVVVDRHVGVLVAILAALKAGGAYLPVDLTTPGARVSDMLVDAGVTLAITEPRHHAMLGEVRAIDIDDPAADAPDTDPDVRVHPAQLAYVMYTSGSTGKPKGVLIEHRCVAAFVDGVRRLYPVDADDRYVQFSSLAFDVSTFDIFGALLTGASVHVANSETRRSLPRINRLLRERAITLYMGTPGILRLLNPADFPHLRLLAVGGEPFDAELADRWAQGRQFLNSYGPTETTVGVVTHRHRPMDRDTANPIGRAMPNHRAYALDARMQPVPVDVVGELYIGGPGVGRGYFGKPAMTAAVFVPDPWSEEPGTRLYRTGDLVHWRSDGQLIFHGRVDGQVKVRGMRVELGEVVAALRSRREVSQAVVRAFPDDISGTRLVAFVVPAGGTLEERPLRAALGSRLPDYMIPSEIVTLDVMPLADTGKIDEAALAAAREEAAARARTATTTKPRTEPRTCTEERLLTKVLLPVMETDAVDVDANLFEAGATSLHIIQVLNRIQEVFGVEVPVGDVFADPTARGLASAIDRTVGAEIRASVRDAYDQIADEYAAYRAGLPDPLPDKWSGLVADAAPGTACEIGAGSGTTLSELLAATHELVATDISRRQLDRLSARLPGVTVVHGDLIDSDLPEGAFSLIVAADVLAHLPREQLPLALGAIVRSLAPGGTLLTSMADEDEPGTVQDWFGAPVFRSGYPAERNRQLLAEAGLSVVDEAPHSWHTPAGIRPARWYRATLDGGR